MKYGDLRYELAQGRNWLPKTEWASAHPAHPPWRVTYAPVACLKIIMVHNFTPVNSIKRKSVIRMIEYEYVHQMNLTTNVKQLGSQP